MSANTDEGGERLYPQEKRHAEKIRTKKAARKASVVANLVERISELEAAGHDFRAALLREELIAMRRKRARLLGCAKDPQADNHYENGNERHDPAGATAALQRRHSPTIAITGTALSSQRPNCSLHALA